MAGNRKLPPTVDPPHSTVSFEHRRHCRENQTYPNRRCVGPYRHRRYRQRLQQRIDWLQQRIQRGVADRSLTRQEANRAQAQINALRREADVLDQRLDNLSRTIRWSRTNGNGRDLDRYRTDYDASRYYRENPRYRETRLDSNDEIYRGSDGRYYCKRSDGTIGLVIGGVGGAALGNVIDGGGNRLAGTLIGGALGALLGQSVDRNSSDLRCR